MRIQLLAFLFLFFAFQLHAQTATDTMIYAENDTIHVDTPPEFDGGPVAFARFIGGHLLLPAEDVIGIIYAEYVVETNGSLSNIRIIKGVSAACDQAVIDALSQSPQWKPGVKNGIPVRVKKIASIKISRTEESKVKSKKKRK